MDGAVMVSKNEQFNYAILEDFRHGKISKEAAGMLLGVSKRTVQRQAKKIRTKGINGIKHGNYKKKPHNAKSDELKAQMMKLANEKYYDFNMVHCLEMLAKYHDLSVSYATFHSWCRAAGIGKRKRRRSGKKRVYRERMANEGLLLQMDGSHHKWNGKDDWVVIAMIDDASSEVPYAEFFSSEDTWNCLKVLRRVIEIKGIPEAIYVDRAGWFGGLKRQYFSQFVRACDELGIRVIYANSPEAKGRIERVWQTFQDRLIPELRIHEKSTMEAANRYLLNTFLPEYWQERNTVIPTSLESRYRSIPADQNLDDVFCMKYERIVRNDHTVSFDTEMYSLKGSFVGSIKGKIITIHKTQQGDLRAYYGVIEVILKPIPKRYKSWQKVGDIRRA